MKKKVVIILVAILITILISILFYWINNKNTEWKITQFGDNVGAQMMCYTVEGNKKRINNNIWMCS